MIVARSSRAVAAVANPAPRSRCRAKCTAVAANAGLTGPLRAAISARVAVSQAPPSSSGTKNSGHWAVAR
jgi:hypothetical protein